MGIAEITDAVAVLCECEFSHICPQFGRLTGIPEKAGGDQATNAMQCCKSIFPDDLAAIVNELQQSPFANWRLISGICSRNQMKSNGQANGSTQ